MKLKEFTGLTVLPLTTSTGNVFADILLLLNKALQTIETDPSGLDLYLALAYFERVCGVATFDRNIEIAYDIATDKQKNIVNNVKI